MRQAEKRAIDGCNRILAELKARPIGDYTTVDKVESLLNVRYNVAYKYIERLVTNEFLVVGGRLNNKRGGWRNRYHLTKLGELEEITSGFSSDSFEELNKYWPLFTIIKPSGKIRKVKLLDKQPQE